jgi:predicted transcriptional regulator
MPSDLKEIKKLRNRLGLTQSDLAKRSGVSQSLIAKIEAGTIDPTYTKAMKIFITLDDLEKKEDIKAHDIMNRKVVSISSREEVRAAVAKMKKLGISQMPVIDSHTVVGLISESILLDALVGGKGKHVGDVMQESPPTVSKTASIKILTSLLHHYPMVLVSDAGVIIGLITKADVLERLYQR